MQEQVGNVRIDMELLRKNKKKMLETRNDVKERMPLMASTVDLT